jgi:nucleotide-binding universal stress UspA family protein
VKILDRILVALDGSETAEAILPHVRRLLRRQDSELILVRAVHSPLSEEQASAIEALIGQAREYVATMKERLDQEGIRASVEVRVGPPAGVLLDIAEEKRVSLIAVTTHGRSGLSRALLGSVAEIVLRKSPVPVFALRPVEGVSSGKELGPIKGILVPTDLSGGSEAILDPAADLAKLFGARLVFLHVRHPAKPLDGGAKDGDENEARSRLHELAALAQAQGVPTAEILDVGEDVPEQILANARFHGCDLIAMTSHGRSAVSRLVVGSVTENVLRESTLPLLIVRSEQTAKQAGKIPA